MQRRGVPVPIGDYVYEARKLRGLTQQELADRAGVSRSTIMNVERDIHSLSVSHLCMIARALDVSPAALIPAD